ncbi:MAG: hypothetical protein WBA28_08955 [Microbacteriaceae bacterium]
MRVFKNIILPIFWVLIFAAISGALVKIAFFPDSTQNPDLLNPGGELVTPTVIVDRGTVVNELQLSGVVNRNADIAMKATLSGKVIGVHTSVGASVEAGGAIVTIRQDSPKKDIVVKAPAKGTIKTLNFINEQYVSLGDLVGDLSPEAFNVSATVEPTQLYRLLDTPAEAGVEITGGPAPFTCTALKVLNDDNGSRVTCAIPADIQVFAGLPANLIIQSGIAEDVLIIPTTAVEGGSGSGNVWISHPDGSTEVREVTLGLSDGYMVEVLTGLEQGEQILQFVPGAMGDPNMPGMPGPMPMPMPGGDSCFVDENGVEICQEILR